MTEYYSQKLSGSRLQRCYELASERVGQYLEAEILYAVGHLRPTDRVLELGCGYGRIAQRLARVARHVVGIDTASESLKLARRLLKAEGNCDFMCMDALDLNFPDCSFDVVVCLQNGICAFGVDQLSLLEEALRVTREGGIVLFSSYSDGFWPDRLAWFEAQAKEGLVGDIDRAASGDGVVVCKDGFRSGRMTPDDFRTLCSRIGVEPQVTEVDGSSVFCEIIKSIAAQQDGTNGEAAPLFTKAIGRKAKVPLAWKVDTRYEKVTAQTSKLLSPSLDVLRLWRISCRRLTTNYPSGHSSVCTS